MKLAIYLLFSTVTISIFMPPIHAADDNNIEYISLPLTHSIDSDDISIENMYNAGISPINQSLNVAKRKLSSAHDLENYRKIFQLETLTSFKADRNNLQDESFYTILRECPALKLIDVGHNKIATLDNLPVHDQLETLLINNNNIQKLDIGILLRNFSALRRGAFQGNPLTSVTNINGLGRHLEELWFNHNTLDNAAISQLISVCPNLTAELMPGSRVVQRYYSRIKNKYDTFDPYCNHCGGCCTNYNRCLSNGLSIFLGVPILGAITGLAIAGITMEVQYPLGEKPYDYYSWNTSARTAYNAHIEHRESVLGFYSSILIPTCAAGSALIVRGIHRLYRYCITKPEDRYRTVNTRDINAHPQLLSLIEDVVDPTPSQEDELL